MIVPINKQGECGQDLSHIDLNVNFGFSYQYLGERLSPYIVFCNILYVFFGVIGQLGGG